MIKAKKAVIRKSPLFPVYAVAAAIAIMIAANVMQAKASEDAVQATNISGY